MANQLLHRKKLFENDVQRLALKLAHKIAPFDPDMVVYLNQGGRCAGLTVAEALGIPAEGIDLSYPLSRFLNRAPGILQIFAWPLKEIAYRFLKPRLNAPLNKRIKANRIALIDDSASTGRSLKAGIRALKDVGIDRTQIQVAVLRRGRRASAFVDHFEIDKPVLFIGR